MEAGLGLSALSAVYLPRGSAPQYGRWQSFGATAKQFIVSVAAARPPLRTRLVPAPAAAVGRGWKPR